MSKLAQLKIESQGGSHSASNKDLGVIFPNDNGKELLQQASRRVAQLTEVYEVPSPQTLHDGQSPGAGGHPHFSMNVRPIKEISKHPK